MAETQAVCLVCMAMSTRRGEGGGLPIIPPDISRHLRLASQTGRRDIPGFGKHRPRFAMMESADTTHKTIALLRQTGSQSVRSTYTRGKTCCSTIQRARLHSTLTWVGQRAKFLLWRLTRAVTQQNHASKWSSQSSSCEFKQSLMKTDERGGG